MELVINISMVICFVLSNFFLIANLTGNFIFKVLARLVGFTGVLLPSLYFLSKFGILIIK